MTDDLNPVAAPRRTIYRVGRQQKRAMLKHLLSENTWPRIMVYVRTKYAVARLGKQLEQDGFTVALVHNSMGKVRRADAVQAFAAGEARILVSSDMATRGMELPGSIDCIINFDLPTEPCLEQREMHIALAPHKLFLLDDDEEGILNENPLFESKDYQYAQLAGFAPNPEAVQKKPSKRKPTPTAEGSASESAQRRAKRNPIGRKPATDRRQNANRPGRNAKPRNRGRASADAALLDENGDVNGNTLVSDNSNRSAVDLACDGNGLSKKRTNAKPKNRQRKQGSKRQRRQVPSIMGG